MAGLGPPEGEKTEKRGGERPGLWRVVGKAARAWRCAEWVRMCWSWWMIELNRTELHWTELNWIQLNWIEVSLFDWTDWLQLSIFKPKRPSIEWCMLFYARVTREWWEKLHIFFHPWMCRQQWFWTFLWSCGVYRIHPTRITASGFSLTAHQVGRKRLHGLFPSFRMEPKSDGVRTFLTRPECYKVSNKSSSMNTQATWKVFNFHVGKYVVASLVKHWSFGFLLRCAETWQGGVCKIFFSSSWWLIVEGNFPNHEI